MSLINYVYKPAIMSSETFEENREANIHLGSSIYLSDLLRIEWNYAIRWEVLIQYLE